MRDKNQKGLADPQEPPQKETITYERRKAKRGRNIDASHLPRETVIHDLTGEERQCSCCDQKLVFSGEGKSEKLEYIPALLEVIEHVRPKYTCRQCETIKAAKKRMKSFLKVWLTLVC